MFALVASLGVLQVAAYYGGLMRLLFFKNHRFSGLLGAALVVGAFVWFFAPGPHNIPDTHGGLDGNQQTGLFAAGAGTAVALTLLLSSLLNYSRHRGIRSLAVKGLEALKEVTYFEALFIGSKELLANWRKLTRRYFSG